MKRFTSFSTLIILLFPVLLSAQSVAELPLAERLERHVEILASDSLEGRGLGTDGKVRAKNYIAGQFEEFGLEPLRRDYFHRFRIRQQLAWIPATNVVGFLEGSDPVLRNDVIVIGAHYDHLGYVIRDGERVIYPGADDNASGTASMMELARYFSENRSEAPRSIIFIAFDAEESGLIGAREFLRDSTLFDHNRIKAMFSLDMVGMYGTHGGLDLKGMGALRGGPEMARRAASGEASINLKNTSADIERRTDTWEFGLRGIPAIHAFTGLKSPYHKPEDTYDLLDYEGMAKINLYLRELVKEMGAAESLEPSAAFLRFMSPTGLRMNVGGVLHLGGGHHKYPDQFFRANNAFSFSGGVMMQLHVGERLTFQPELLYDFNGSKSPVGTFRRHSVTLPVNTQINIVSEPGFARVFPFLGPYYRLSFSGTDGTNDLDFDVVHRQSEFGLNAGVGVEYMNFQVSFTWRHAVTSLNRSPFETVFDSGRFISLAYRL